MRNPRLKPVVFPGQLSLFEMGAAPIASDPFSKPFFTQPFLRLAITPLFRQTDQMNHNVQLFIGTDVVAVAFLDRPRDPFDTGGFARMVASEHLVGAEVVVGLGAEIFFIDDALGKEAAVRDEAVALAVFLRRR